MLDAPFGFAFAAGAVAAFNPCGFALLPAYLSFFLGVDVGSADAGTLRRVASALRVAAAVSVGFVVVFGLAGAAISQASVTVQSITPWISIGLGVALVPAGVAMAFGWQPKLALPRLGRRRRGADDRSVAAMAWFGASFATVSLSCTIPTFLIAVVSTFEQGEAVAGLAVFGAYTAGMTAVMATLTVAMALARRTLVVRLRVVLPYVQRTAGSLLAVAGAYVAYYGWYDIRTEQGRSVPTGPIDAVGTWSGRVTEWVDRLGNGPLVAAGVAFAALSIAIALLRRRPDPTDPSAAGGHTS